MNCILKEVPRKQLRVLLILEKSWKLRKINSKTDIHERQANLKKILIQNAKKIKSNSSNKFTTKYSAYGMEVIF